MTALVERFHLARKYRAAGCPSPWTWAGDALRRERAEQAVGVYPTSRLRTPPPI